MPSCTVRSRWCFSSSMWLRRMNAVSSTHLPSGTTSVGASDDVPAASAGPATRSSTTRRTKAAIFALFAEPHLDVAGRADVLADVAADALVVVGVDVAAHRRFLLR